MAEKYENLLLLEAAACCTLCCAKKENAGLDFESPSSQTVMTRATITI